MKRETEMALRANCRRGWASDSQVLRLAHHIAQRHRAAERDGWDHFNQAARRRLGLEKRTELR